MTMCFIVYVGHAGSSWCQCHFLMPSKVATAPEGTQATSLDIERAYHNSPIIPCHKPYLATSWNNSIYVGHVAVEGLATAGGIQGNAADALLGYGLSDRELAGTEPSSSG